MLFEDYAKSFIIKALEQTPPDVAPDVYVVSLLVYDEADDPRFPTVSVGFNTDAQVAETTDDASDPEEARWNFAFWLQNELGVLGDTERNPEGAALRQEWLRGSGLWYEDEDGAFEDQDGQEPGVTERFVELIVTITKQLHAEGTIDRIFGRPIPVLIHELEYYDEIAEQNLRANPDGLADEFARWIEGM
jgi:hypothetical protein